MKKIIALLTASMLALTACNAPATQTTSDRAATESNNVLKFYNWGEYIGEDVISRFEDEYNAKVICEYYDSNEMMYTKLQAGDKYDVLIPSDYMIERLLNEDMLQPINKDEIPNMSNLTDSVKNLSYDSDNTYSVPFFQGSVGIVYNKTKISPEEIKNQGWEILRNEKYKDDIYMYDSERDAFMIALKALGYSMNTDNEKEIDAAYQWLLEQKERVNPVYVTDEVIDSMANGLKSMGVVYSGDAAYVLRENPDMAYFAPDEGTNLWSDAMVIPKNAENPELANKFINFMLEDESALDNTLTVGYTTSNKNVYEQVTADGGDFCDNEAYVIRTDNKKDEVFHDNEVIRAKLSELLIKVKA